MGCYSGLGSGPGSEVDDGSSGGSAPGEDSGSVPSGCEKTPGQVIALRLTRTEYNNTLRDLFRDFDVGSPADGLPDDVPGANGLTVSDFYLEKHEKAVTELAAQVVDNGFITCDPAVDARACAREVFEPPGLTTFGFATHALDDALRG